MAERRNEEDRIGTKPADEVQLAASRPVANGSTEREYQEEVLSDRTREALGEIRRLTNQLAETSRAALFRSEEDRALQSALEELRSVARDIGNAVGSELRRSYYPVPQPERPCGCGATCEHVSSDCCCFEIILLRARVMEEQKLPEIADGAGPGEAQALELIFNVLADGEGEVYPSLTSFMPIEKKQKWVPINKTIRKICIRCGETRIVPLTVEALEVEELAAGGRAEFGSNFSTLALKCGCPTVPAQVSVELTGGGIAGGEVLVEIGARQL